VILGIILLSSYINVVTCVLYYRLIYIAINSSNKYRGEIIHLYVKKLLIEQRMEILTNDLKNIDREINYYRALWERRFQVFREFSENDFLCKLASYPASYSVIKGLYGGAYASGICKKN
jgi:hypothetical protein